jgi:serine/threonine protein kinase
MLRASVDNAHRNQLIHRDIKLPSNIMITATAREA